MIVGLSRLLFHCVLVLFLLHVASQGKTQIFQRKVYNSYSCPRPGGLEPTNLTTISMASGPAGDVQGIHDQMSYKIKRKLPGCTILKVLS